MAMTSDSMNPAPANILSVTGEQVKAAAAKLKAEAEAKEAELRAAAIRPEDPLAGVKDKFEDEISAEAAAIVKELAAQTKAQVQTGGKAIHELVEDDAYNLDVAIAAKGMSSPDFLKVTLKDSNYIARWCNRNPIRMSQLAGQGFRFVKADEVLNLSSLEMFRDSQDNFVYADLVAMKVPKNVYYAGLRRAYLKSLHATNNKKAAEAGAAFAASRLQGELTGSERSYMAEHQESGSKPIYNPNLGV